MTVFLHEMKFGRKTLVIWTGAIGFMLLICLIMFPQMKNEMGSVTDMFANMGGFTAAFGMDRINFGTAMGFYGIECGNILGIGGGFFAALLGISVLAKEENEHTAEFLLTHPISRSRIVTEKLLAVMAQLLIMNAAVTTVSVLSFLAIGEEIPVSEFALLHTSYLLLQVEIAAICFGVSAFLRRGGIGIGLGLAAMLYFLNIIGNISEKAEFVKYITPFAYAEASDIITNAELDGVLIAIGFVCTAVGIAAAYLKYMHKDIAA